MVRRTNAKRRSASHAQPHPRHRRAGVRAAWRVSGTSLGEIAKVAGLTRGAIYWHFTDKADLFNAMMERVTLPLEEADDACGVPGAPTSRCHRCAAVSSTCCASVMTDPQMRRVFDIATHKVEYVGEMNAVRERHLAMRNGCLTDIGACVQARCAQRRTAQGHRRRAAVAAIGPASRCSTACCRTGCSTATGFDLLARRRAGVRCLPAWAHDLRRVGGCFASAAAPAAAGGGAARPWVAVLQAVVVERHEGV